MRMLLLLLLVLLATHYILTVIWSAGRSVCVLGVGAAEGAAAAYRESRVWVLGWCVPGECLEGRVGGGWWVPFTCCA